MLDVEKFISEVEKYPLLYDHRAQNHKNKPQKCKCWCEVGKAMFENWHDLPQEVQEQRSRLLVSKWKGLRDNFVREYRVLRKCETEGVPPPKKSKYLHFDRLLFLVPHLYGGGHKPPDDEKALDDVKTSDDVKPFQLLEIIYGEDVADDSSKRKSPRKLRTSGNPEESAADRFTLKNMTIKIPEQWTSNKYGTKSMDKLVSSGIPEELANERETMQSVASWSPVVSSVTSISASTAHNSTYDFVYDCVPMHCDDRNQDKHGNRAFLLSFVPMMDNLPLHLSLQARKRITQVFNDLVTNIPPETG